MLELFFTFCTKSFQIHVYFVFILYLPFVKAWLINFLQSSVLLLFCFLVCAQVCLPASMYCLHDCVFGSDRKAGPITDDDTPMQYAAILKALKMIIFR